MKRGRKAIKNSARLVLVIGIAATAVYFLSSIHREASADTISAEAAISDEVVVEVKPGASIDAIDQRNQTTIIERINLTNFYRLRIPGRKSEKKWQARLAADPDVLSATPNSVLASPLMLFGRRTLAFPSNQAQPGQSITDYQTQQWATNLHLTEAQTRSKGEGVVVAVIDTGVDLSHPALAGHLWVDNRPNGEIPNDGIDNDHDGYVDDYHGWNFVDNNNDITDTPGDPATTIAGHGTFIAGLIALMAPEAKIMPIKAFPPSGVTNAFVVAAAVKYAADHGANIINLSFGSPAPSGVLAEALSDAESRGIMMAAAVGNDGKNVSIFPANSGKALGVAAVANDDKLASFSNFGSDVSVDAPGVDMISTYPGGQYAKWSGTSFSAPLVSAEGALVLGDCQFESRPGDVIQSSAISIDSINPQFSGKIGKGLINPVGALKSINSGPEIPTPNDVTGKLDLIGGPVESSSRGAAALYLNGSDEELTVDAALLNPRAIYHLFIDGIPVPGADVPTTSMGSLGLNLANQPSAGEISIPPSFLPLTGIKRIELKDDLGNVYVLGTFAPISVGTGPTYQDVSKVANLTWVSDGAGPGGRASVDVSIWREALTVEAEGIGDSSCQIFVDNVRAGTVQPQAGYVRLELTSDGSEGLPMPAALRPVFGLKHIEVRDSSGTTVLMQGDFQPGGSDLGGGDSSGVGSPGQNFSIEGTIQTLPASINWLGDWTVSGRTVHISTSTEIKLEGGVIAVGAVAQVIGVVQPDGSISADELDLKPVSDMSGDGGSAGSGDGEGSGGDGKGGGGSGGSGGSGGDGGGSGGGGSTSVDILGTVQSLPVLSGLVGDWLVSGVVVHVSSSTEIRQDGGMVMLGVSVEVRGNSRADASVDAARIDVKSSDGGGSGHGGG